MRTAAIHHRRASENGLPLMRVLLLQLGHHIEKGAVPSGIRGRAESDAAAEAIERPAQSRRPALLFRAVRVYLPIGRSLGKP